MPRILVFSVIHVLYYVAQIPQDGWWILLAVPEYVPPFTLVPRFILSLRALYVRDLQGRHRSDVDTAFGLTSTAIQATSISTIIFAYDGQNEGLEQGDEMEMREMEGEIPSTDSSA